MPGLRKMVTGSRLEMLYKKYNRREFVHPDPLEFLYNYKDVRDREIAGLIASSLAYGRVAQILKSVSIVLGRMGRSPYGYLMSKRDKEIVKDFVDFKHRFTTGRDKADLLIGIRHVVRRYGSLKKCFKSGYKNNDKTTVPALSFFVSEMIRGAGVKKMSLLPSPELGSACKRLHLYLRWMIRKDAVDPGGWDDIPCSKLIIPLDTHMHRIGRALGFTKRRQADLRTALEVTDGFAVFSPEDPVRYDFALTRFGIRPDMSIEDLTF